MRCMAQLVDHDIDAAARDLRPDRVGIVGERQGRVVHRPALVEQAAGEETNAHRAEEVVVDLIAADVDRLALPGISTPSLVLESVSMPIVVRATDITPGSRSISCSSVS